MRIFIHAPEGHRTKKAMEMHGDAQAKARKSIARPDEAHGAQYKSISNQKWGAPTSTN